MALAENFEGVTRVLDEIRQQSNRDRNERVYIDFREIEDISVGAALAFAAELDRWNHVPHHRGRKLRAVDVDEWDEHVRQRLEDMGFFDLLDVQVSEKDRQKRVEYQVHPLPVRDAGRGQGDRGPKDTGPSAVLRRERAETT